MSSSSASDAAFATTIRASEASCAYEPSSAAAAAAADIGDINADADVNVSGVKLGGDADDDDDDDDEDEDEDEDDDDVGDRNDDEDAAFDDTRSQLSHKRTSARRRASSSSSSSPPLRSFARCRLATAAIRAFCSAESLVVALRVRGTVEVFIDFVDVTV